MKISSFFLFILCSYSNIWAASCCGGSQGVPSLILGEDRKQMSLAVSQSEVKQDVSASGETLPRSQSNQEDRQNFALTAVSRLAESWQVGFTLQALRKQRSRMSETMASAGLSDLSMLAAYEVFPETYYSVWKPKVFLYTSFLIPLGKSTYESVSPVQVDVTTRGFYTLSFGAVAQKVWYRWDSFLTAEINKPFSRQFSGGQNVSQDIGGTIGAGIGYSPKNSKFSAFRAGARAQITKMGQRQWLTDIASEEWLPVLGLDLAYLIYDGMTLAISYNDQSLFPALAKSTALTRGLSISYQWRW